MSIERFGFTGIVSIRRNERTFGVLFYALDSLNPAEGVLVGQLKEIGE